MKRKLNRTIKRKGSSEDRLRLYEMEKRSLYYTCKTQQELNEKLLELAKRYGI